MRCVRVIDGAITAGSFPRMFIIIGGDGKEYGPATVAQIRAWLGAGRANLETKAKALGSEEWRRLGDYAEFSDRESPPPIISASQEGRDLAWPARAGADETELAGIGARTGAALVNAVIYFLSMMPGSMIMSRRLLEKYPELERGTVPHLDEFDLHDLTDAMIWVWAGLLAAMLLQAVLIAIRGQNLGKLVAGVRVVRVGTGGPAGFVRAVVLRFALPVLFMFALNLLFPLGCLFLLVDYFFMFREDRRCLHDLIAGTQVVRI